MMLKVGELSKRTGLTIRTLHHYDEIGLLNPSHRSEAGYRMYTREDLARLHQIQALKQLGLGLAEIGETLATNGEALGDIIAKQLEALDRQAEKSARLRKQLIQLKAKMDQGVKPEVADLLATLELMTMHEKYFTSEEMKSLERHRESAGVDLSTRWAELVPAIRTLMELGTDPAQPEPQQRLDQWLKLVEAMTGNDPTLWSKLAVMSRNEPSMQAQTGIDSVLLSYVMACMQARNAGLYQQYLTPQEIERVMQGRVKTAAQWPTLIAARRSQFENGAAITDPAVRELAEKWKVLYDVTHAGDDGSLRAKLRVAYEQKPELLRGTGLDLPLLNFVGRAMAAL